MTKAGGTAFRKDVDFVTKDDDEQIAAGIVMVPDKVDLQRDFAREETIREFAEQFGNFVDVDEGDGGVMHAAWPSDWMSLERNEVLDEATEIGGAEVPAGAWVQEWMFNDDELWSLVDDGILAGYSIGAVNVSWDGPFEQGEPDDVTVPSEIDDDELIWELAGGIIREVSAVDIPAVPDALILETKSEKRLADHLGNRDGFVEEAIARGHTEAEAERLWDVLNRAIDVEGASEPGKQSMFARAGKAFFSALMGDPTDTAIDQRDRTRERATDPQKNGDEEESDKDATGGDTPDPSGTEAADMSDDDPNDNDGGAKALAEKNAEQIKELTSAVETLTETLKGDVGEKTVEIEIDGEVHEVKESQLKAAVGADQDDDGDDPIKTLVDDVKELADRVDTISRQSGYSDQLEANTGDGEDDDSGLSGLGKALS